MAVVATILSAPPGLKEGEAVEVRIPGKIIDARDGRIVIEVDSILNGDVYYNDVKLEAL